MRRIAAAQHGVVARRQLLGAGVGEVTIKACVAAGVMRSVHRGVYAVGDDALSREGAWLAAILLGGNGAVLSHRSAAALHGIRASGGAVDVTLAGPRSDKPGIRFHRAVGALVPEDVTVVGGIPVTRVARTLVDLAAALPTEELAELVGDADRAELLDRPALDDARERVAAAAALGRGSGAGPGEVRLRIVLARLDERNLRVDARLAVRSGGR